jgi:hypothetical protein
MNTLNIKRDGREAERTIDTVGDRSYCPWCVPCPDGPDDPANRHVAHSKIERH